MRGSLIFSLCDPTGAGSEDREMSLSRPRSSLPLLEATREDIRFLMICSENNSGAWPRDLGESRVELLFATLQYVFLTHETSF